MGDRLRAWLVRKLIGARPVDFYVGAGPSPEGTEGKVLAVALQGRTDVLVMIGLNDEAALSLSKEMATFEEDER